MKRSFARSAAALTWAFGAIALTSVHAATFTVTTLSDLGAGSLRQAISDANTAGGADTIVFGLGGTITLASTLPSVTDAAGLTIDGAGQTVTISGNNAVRVLEVAAGATLFLNNVTIANGRLVGSSGAGLTVTTAAPPLLPTAPFRATTRAAASVAPSITLAPC